MGSERKKVLITGVAGFVGYHLLVYLYNNIENIQVCGIDIKEPAYNYKKFAEKIKVEFYQVDLLNIKELERIFDRFLPDYIVHLASYSSVAYSWKYPKDSFVNNTNIFLNLIETIRKKGISCRILSVGSSEEYGIVNEEQLPLKETEKLNPESPYAVARVSQELLSRVFAKNYGIDIVLTRSFNHIGPYQDTQFAVSGFIKQMLEVKMRKERSGTIETGELSIIRDFVDVRDVVDAYWRLLLRGKAGELYNVCSGKGISLQRIVNIIAEEMKINIVPKINERMIRPSDNPVIIGDFEKLKREIGWECKISLQQTLKDMIRVQEERMSE